MIALPPLVVDQPHPIGRIRHLIRNGESVEIADRGEVHISPRITQPLFRLVNGERIVITERRNVECPQEADGVLQRLPDGQLRWVVHRLIVSFMAKVQQNGWPAISHSIAESWNGRFSFRAESRLADGSIAPGEEGLRPPQLGALHAIGAHWSIDCQPATIVMPTGTGKTETMLAALAAYVRGPLLVVVPWDLLRTQTAEKFLTFGLLRRLKVLHSDAPNPIVGIVTKRPTSIDDLDIFNSCNVIVATSSTISIGEASPLMNDISRQCAALILDEAHHVAAKSWSQIRDAFRNVKTLQFTATPYRRDGHVVDGKVIFNYPLGSAQRDEYFKSIQFEPVYEIGNDRADKAIAAVAIHQLRKDIEDGFDHLLMARCESISRATNVQAIYSAIAPEFNPVLIHSKRDDTVERISALRSGRSRIAICVDMLGEGFDLPQLKIAAVHDMHRSLAILALR